MAQETFYTKYIKGLLDRVLGILGLILLSWLFLILGAAVFLNDPGPVFYKQRRFGRKKNGEYTYFNILKFRTMKVNTPELPTHHLKNPEQYITGVGRFLRKTSLDELPQLWNIGILHNLSIIGPRPALWNQEDLIAEREKYGANDVMPGLTGWAQINGRDEIDDEEKARLDGEYVRKISFRFDAKCFFGTVAAVLKHKGVAEGGTGTIKNEEETAVK